MSSTRDKAGGLANEAIGKIKQGVGSLVGSEELRAKGMAQEMKGHAQQAVGDAKDAVTHVVEGVSAATRDARIRDRAYEIWEAEGHPHGRDAQHWQQAEHEVDGSAKIPS